MTPTEQAEMLAGELGCTYAAARGMLYALGSPARVLAYCADISTAKDTREQARVINRHVRDALKESR